MIIPIAVIGGIGVLLGGVWFLKSRKGGSGGTPKRKKSAGAKKKAGGRPPGGPPKYIAEEGLKIDESVVGDLEVEMTINPLPKQFKMSTPKTQTGNSTPSPEAAAMEDSRAGKSSGLAGADSLQMRDGADSLALN